MSAILPKIITVLKRYRPIVLELIEETVTPVISRVRVRVLEH